MTTTTLYVPGVPAPQGSKSGFVRNGRAVLVEGTSAAGRAKHKAWRTAVTLSAIEYRNDNDLATIEGPVAISITFLMPRPKSAPKKLRWAAKKPDIDKLLRSTFDGLTDAQVWRDDSQVVQLVDVKKVLHDLQQYSGTGAFIQWVELDQ